MTSGGNGFLLIQGAVPLREVIPLRRTVYPPTLYKKSHSALSMTRLINKSHLVMSVDITQQPFKAQKAANASQHV